VPEGMMRSVWAANASGASSVYSASSGFIIVHLVGSRFMIAKFKVNHKMDLPNSPFVLLKHPGTGETLALQLHWSVKSL
jgi:hypothetical protein